MDNGLAGRENTGGLAGLLSKEKQLFTEYLELTSEQSELLASEETDTEALNENIDARQKLIETAEKLHQEINVLMQSYTAEDDEVRGLREQIREILMSIQAGDKKNKKLIEEHKSRYVGELKKLNLNRKGIITYNMDRIAGMDTSYFDKRQ